MLVSDPPDSYVFTSGHLVHIQKRICPRTGDLPNSSIRDLLPQKGGRLVSKLESLAQFCRDESIQEPSIPFSSLPTETVSSPDFESVYTTMPPPADCLCSSTGVTISKSGIWWNPFHGSGGFIADLLHASAHQKPAKKPPGA
ncbi:uncharacterized protein Z518_00508 [Rhinocladiella mackenziei CBS 650.93]|uniref:Uncharacterized protein n=1 Tax=Rhinocladiella mackenziei CBS 650.93 TaxID=1442369 RepID=A0A0D2HFG3_9EURO|nr:uncharacterized protein Z518_00508 [Rhinocladiella mackenziei CBS 650.93]KIX09428.1 hypothetical protein Z518_00508 [Rhinocladiella mackenziei CBS 650.93]